MSTPTLQPIFLHEWTISTTQTVDEITERVENGQPVKVTRKVPKEVPVKMALKKLTRREAGQLELFRLKQYSTYFNLGLPTESMIRTRHSDIAGGLFSEKERARHAQLLQKLVDLEEAHLAAKNKPEEEQKQIMADVFAVREQINAYNIAQQMAYENTVESKTLGKVSFWVALFLTYIEKNGRMVPYFEGDTFEQKEEFQMGLEEKEDEFFSKAYEKISFTSFLFARGVDSPEQFKLIEEEMAAKEKAEKEKVVPVEKPAESVETAPAASQ